MLQQAMARFSGHTLIREKYENFIGGQWVAPVRGERAGRAEMLVCRGEGEVLSGLAAQLSQ